MLSLDMIILFVIGFAFMIAGTVMYNKSKKKKSTDQRMQEIFKDYDKMMDEFRR